jgi:hypothetical protein
MFTGAVGLVVALSAGCADSKPLSLPCTFARTGDPFDMKGGAKDVINAPSQILSAPPGGLWWIAEASDPPIVVAQSDALGSVELEVIPRDQAYFISSPVLALRVPQNLSPGTRLTIGTTELWVVASTPPVNLADIVVTRSYRSELGGTGVTIRVPPGTSNRVLIHRAYVVFPTGNVAGGVLAIQHLLVSDAPRLCPLAPAVADEVFVPVWVGDVPMYALVIMMADANDPDLLRSERLTP